MKGKTGNILFGLLAITALFLLPGAVHAQVSQEYNFTSLGPDVFFITMNSYDNYVLIDVRTYKEYRKKRIAGAHLAETRDRLKQMADSLDFDQPLFVYCSDDYRSPVACRLLEDMGFKKIYDLEGGLLAWERAGYHIEKKRLKIEKRRLKRKKNH